MSATTSAAFGAAGKIIAPEKLPSVKDKDHIIIDMVTRAHIDADPFIGPPAQPKASPPSMPKTDWYAHTKDLAPVAHQPIRLADEYVKQASPVAGLIGQKTIFEKVDGILTARIVEQKFADMRLSMSDEERSALQKRQLAAQTSMLTANRAKEARKLGQPACAII